jgi:hypothetical protein
MASDVRVGGVSGEGGEGRDEDVASEQRNVTNQERQMKQSIVWVISGKAASGKDTVGKMIAESVSRRPGVLTVRHYSFAARLKQIESDIWGRSGGEYADKAARRGRYVALGAAVRAIDEDAWARIVYNQIIADKPDHATITDCRYRNELSMFVASSALYGIPVRVEALESVRAERMAARGTSWSEYEPFAGHVSECEMDNQVALRPWSVVVNDGTDDQLRETVERFVANSLEVPF